MVQGKSSGHFESLGVLILTSLFLVMWPWESHLSSSVKPENVAWLVLFIRFHWEHECECGLKHKALLMSWCMFFLPINYWDHRNLGKPVRCLMTQWLVEAWGYWWSRMIMKRMCDISQISMTQWLVEVSSYWSRMKMNNMCDVALRHQDWGLNAQIRSSSSCYCLLPVTLGKFLTKSQFPHL